MSENPTARFAPSVTCYELYENFQIELQELKKQISSKESVEKQGENDVLKNIENSPKSVAQKRISELVLGKIDLVSDIMENMFTKLTNLMNDASKDKDFYSLKQKLDEQNQMIFELKEEGVQMRTQQGQQKASHKLKKKQLKNQIAAQNIELNEQKQLLNSYKEEMNQLFDKEQNKVKKLEKWFVRLLEKIELDLVEQQNTKLDSVIEKVRNSRKNKPWKNIICDSLNPTNTNSIQFNQQNNKYNQIGKKDDKILLKSETPNNHKESGNFEGKMYSDLDEEDLSNMTSNNPSTDEKPASLDKSINQAFIFSDDRSSNASNPKERNNLIPNRLPFTSNNCQPFIQSNILSLQFNKSEKQEGENESKENILSDQQSSNNNFNNNNNDLNFLYFGEEASQKVNNFLRQNKLDLSVSQLEQEVLNLFQKTDRSTTNAHLNLKDVQLEDILNVTQQNNSISLELDFNKENKMSNTNKQANTSLEKLLNSFSTKLSQKMKNKDLKENFPQELSPISSTQGKSQNNTLNLNFSSVDQQNDLKCNLMNSSMLNLGTNILPLNNNNSSNMNNSNNLNNNISGSNLMLSFIKGTNNNPQNVTRKYNNTMSNNTDLFILKEIADSESKEDGDKDILQILSASVNNFNTTKNIQEFEKKLFQNNLVASQTQNSTNQNNLIKQNVNQSNISNVNNQVVTSINLTSTQNNNNNISQVQPKCTYDSLSQILQNIKIEDQQPDFLDQSQNFSKDIKLNQTTFQSESSINLNFLQSQNNNQTQNNYKNPILNNQNNNSNTNNDLYNNNNSFKINFNKNNNRNNYENNNILQDDTYMNQTYFCDESNYKQKKSQDSCFLLGDFQMDNHKQSSKLSTSNNDQKVTKNNFHKKSVSMNVPKLDLSGISVQNNNTMNNIQINNNSNNSFFFTNQISDSPIQTEKNQTSKKLRYEEEQTERRNNKNQQDSQKDQNLFSNIIEKSNLNKNEVSQNPFYQQNILDSPSSFKSKSGYKQDGNNSFLTENQNFDILQFNKMQIDSFSEISQINTPTNSKQMITNSKNQQITLTNKGNTLLDFINQGDKQQQIYNLEDKQQFNNQSNHQLKGEYHFGRTSETQEKRQNNNSKTNTTNQINRFYAQTDEFKAKTILGDNNYLNQQQSQNIEVKMNKNQSKHGLFIDSFNELFNKDNNNHVNISNDSPKVVFDTFNNSLAPNHDDYSNIKQEFINCSSEQNNTESSQNDLNNYYKKIENNQNIFNSNNQYENEIIKKDYIKKQEHQQFVTSNNQHVINQSNILNKTKSQQQNKVTCQLSKNKPIQEIVQNRGNQECDKNELQQDFIKFNQMVDNQQINDMHQQKNTQNLFTRKRVISDHEKVKKDFEQVLNENIQKDKNLDTITNTHQNISHLKQKISSSNNSQTGIQQNQCIYSQKLYNNQQNDEVYSQKHPNKYNEYLEQCQQVQLTTKNNSQQQKQNQKKNEEPINQNYQILNQIQGNIDDIIRKQNAEIKKRAITYDDENKIIKKDTEDQKLKRQIANFTQKKMVENHLKNMRTDQQDNFDQQVQIDEIQIDKKQKIKVQSQYQNLGDLLKEQNNNNINMSHEGSPMIQDQKKKQPSLFAPQQYYIPQKLKKSNLGKQKTINKTMEYCSNPQSLINNKEEFSPCNNSLNHQNQIQSNFYHGLQYINQNNSLNVHSNRQRDGNRLEQEPRNTFIPNRNEQETRGLNNENLIIQDSKNSNLYSNQFFNNINNSNCANQGKQQHKVLNNSLNSCGYGQMNYENNGQHNQNIAFNGDLNERDEEYTNCKQDQVQQVLQKQPLFNRSKQQSISSHPNQIYSQHLEFRNIQNNSKSFDLNNSIDAIKKNQLINPKEKRKPMRVTQLNQPITGLLQTNNTSEIQLIKCQPLSTPNVPISKQNNFIRQTKNPQLIQQHDDKNELKQKQLRSAISPKSIQSQNYNNKENLTTFNCVPDTTNEIDQNQVIQNIQEYQNNYNNILSDCTHTVQNAMMQNKLIQKKNSKQINNNISNVQKPNMSQLNNSVTLKHPTRNRNFSTTNASSLMNNQLNIQQSYKTLNNQSYEEYERFLQFDSKAIQKQKKNY